MKPLIFVKDIQIDAQAENTAESYLTMKNKFKAVPDGKKKIGLPKKSDFTMFYSAADRT